MLRVMTGAVFVAVVAASLSALPPPARAQAASGVAQSAREAWDAIRGYTIAKRDEALAYGRKSVDDADAGIKALEAKVAQTNGEVKAAHEKNLRELRAKRDQAAAKLDDLGKAGAGAWDATKQGFADAFRDLHQSYDKAAAQFK